MSADDDYIVQILERFRRQVRTNLFKGDTARLSCLGGGPGSDIIAVLKYLDEYASKEPVKKLTCYLLDKEQAWADTWTEIDEKLKVRFKLNVNFQPLDVTAPRSWEFQTKFLDADLFTMSYFVSEVRCLDQNKVVTRFWRDLFKRAKPGALFLYVDNGHKDFNSYFDEQCKAAKLKCLIEEDNVAWTPRHEEQASELGVYLKKFRPPKLRGYLSYRVLRKQ